MRLINIGSNPAVPADDTVSFTVRQGDTVTVTNHANSASPVNYLQHGHSGGADGNFTAGNTQTFTTPGTHYLISQGRSTIQISGGMY